MEFVPVNFLAVLAAGVAYMAVGFVWYGPLFGKPWMKLVKMTEESMKKDQANMARTMGMSFLLSLVTAFVLRHVTVFSMQYYGYEGLMSGLSSAFFMWLGFVMPVQATNVLFQKEPLKLFALNTGYQFVAMLVMGAIVGGWA